jgi:hypothetical protein
MVLLSGMFRKIRVNPHRTEGGGTQIEDGHAHGDTVADLIKDD